VYRPTDRKRLREHYIGWENDDPDDDVSNDEMDLDWEEIDTVL
jgi:hypothetical protein